RQPVLSLVPPTRAGTPLDSPRPPQHLGAEIGFFSVLHTWNQKIELHPHVHCVVPSGRLSLDHTHWIGSRQNYFLSSPWLGKVFSGKFATPSNRPSTTTSSASKET